MTKTEGIALAVNNDILRNHMDGTKQGFEFAGTVNLIKLLVHTSVFILYDEFELCLCFKMFARHLC